MQILRSPRAGPLSLARSAEVPPPAGHTRGVVQVTYSNPTPDGVFLISGESS